MTSFLKREQSKFSSAKRTREFKRAEVGYIYLYVINLDQLLSFSQDSAHSTQYCYTLHYIYTLCTHYLHTIYT